MELSKNGFSRFHVWFQLSFSCIFRFRTLRVLGTLFLNKFQFYPYILEIDLNWFLTRSNNILIWASADSFKLVDVIFDNFEWVCQWFERVDLLVDALDCVFPCGSSLKLCWFIHWIILKYLYVECLFSYASQIA